MYFKGGKQMKDVSMDKFTITEIEQIIGLDLMSEDVLFTLDELQDMTISNAEETTPITGKGGRKLSTLKRNKSVKVSGNSGLISGGLLKAQTGYKGDISAEVSQTILVWEILTVKDNKVTINGNPANTGGSEIKYVYEKKENGCHGKKYTQSPTAGADLFTYADKVITFPEGVTGDVIVYYDTEVTGKYMENLSDNYSAKCRILIEVTVQDNCEQQFCGRFNIPKADMSGNFDLALGGDGTKHPFELESLVGGCGSGTSSKKLWDYFVFTDPNAA